MCRKFRPLNVRRVYNPPAFVLVGCETMQESAAVYHYETADEIDKPASFSVQVKGSQIAGIRLNEPVPASTIRAALKAVEQNEQARGLFDDAKQMSARHELLVKMEAQQTEERG